MQGFYLNDISHPLQSDHSFKVFEKCVSHFYLMRLRPHFSPFVICNVDGENLVLFCTEKTIYRMTSLHAFNRLSCDSLCHIWLVLMTFDTPKLWNHTSTQTASTQTEVFEKAFFVYETNSITASLDCFTLEPVCDSVNLYYNNQFKAQEQFCNNRTKISLHLWII